MASTVLRGGLDLYADWRISPLRGRHGPAIKLLSERPSSHAPLRPEPGGSGSVTLPSLGVCASGRVLSLVGVARQPSKTTNSCVYRSRVSFLQMCVLCATVAIATLPPSLPQDILVYHSLRSTVPILSSDTTGMALAL